MLKSASISNSANLFGSAPRESVKMSRNMAQKKSSGLFSGVALSISSGITNFFSKSIQSQQELPIQLQSALQSLSSPSMKDAKMMAPQM